MATVIDLEAERKIRANYEQSELTVPQSFADMLRRFEDRKPAGEVICIDGKVFWNGDDSR